MRKHNRAPQKLAVRHETLRVLDRAELAAANGGGATTTSSGTITQAKVSSSACDG
jgi:hypothetical protein